VSDPAVSQLGLDVDRVSDFLLARSGEEAKMLQDSMVDSLASQFPQDRWDLIPSIGEYGPDAHQNLYMVEGQRDFRDWLQAQDVSIQEYKDAVGPVQYSTVSVQLKSLLPQARSNRGWRIRLIGFPSLRTIACGLGSHYQGTQNHNQMGQASALIRSRALAVLDDQRDALERWPSATPAHWEERGLMDSPVLRIGNIDLSSFDGGGGAKLRMVRNTTVKKDLATFFAIRGANEESFTERGAEWIRELHDIAVELGSPKGS